MPKVPSSCSHSMCIGGVCAECGARMGQEKARKKGKVKNVVPLSCSHPMRIGSLCTHCGAKVTTVDIENDDKSHIHATTSKITVPGGSTMHMTKAGAASYQADKSSRLTRERRLSLVLDIDHTLIHATDDPTASGYPGADTRSFFLHNCQRMHYIKFRPHLMKFLEEVSRIFELTLYTHGTREYAEAIAESLDREGKLFQRRIVSACDTVELSQRGAKCLSRVFPCGTDMVLVVDDREDVWSEGGQEQNLLLVRPYHFWGVANNPRYFDPGKTFTKVPGAGTHGWSTYGMRSVVLSGGSGGDDDDVSTTTNEEEEQCEQQRQQDGAERHEEPEAAENGKKVRHDDNNKEDLEGRKKRQKHVTVAGMEENDPQLLRVLQVAKDVHKCYYGNINNSKAQRPAKGLHVGSILCNLLKDVLRGVCIVFSGVIPLQSGSSTGTSTTDIRYNQSSERYHYSSLTRRAEMMGASIVSKVRPGVTHVVAARIDTEKAVKGLRTDGCCVVHVDWLLSCIWHMRNVLPADNNLLLQQEGLDGGAHSTLSGTLNTNIVHHSELDLVLHGSSSSSSLDSDLADFSREIDQDLQEGD